MLLPIPTRTWRVLRALARSAAPVPGRELRLAPTRETFDGSFLTRLVDAGLIEVAGGNGKPAKAKAAGTGGKKKKGGKAKPVAADPTPPDTGPFGVNYTLTPLGEHGAEYGEIDVEMPFPKL